jgi:hypothetical protein
MIKNIVKTKYFWHLFQMKYNKVLLGDCLYAPLQLKLLDKVYYHESMVNRLSCKMATD